MFHFKPDVAMPYTASEIVVETFFYKCNMSGFFDIKHQNNT